MIKQGSIITLNTNEEFMVMGTIVEKDITYLYVLNKEDMFDVDILQLTKENKLISIDDTLFKELLVKFNELLNKDIEF